MDFFKNRTRNFGKPKFVPGETDKNQKNLFRWRYMDIFQDLNTRMDNDVRADNRVRQNFFNGKNTGDATTTQKNRVLPFGLKRRKKTNGDFLQATGTCGDSSDHIRMRKLFGRMKFNN